MGGAGGGYEPLTPMQRESNANHLSLWLVGSLIVVSRTPCVLTETDGIDRLDLWQTDVAGSARDRLFNRRTVS